MDHRAEIKPKTIKYLGEDIENLELGFFSGKPKA
jgi:hypothetical protein